MPSTKKNCVECKRGKLCYFSFLMPKKCGLFYDVAMFNATFAPTVMPGLPLSAESPQWSSSVESQRQRLSVSPSQGDSFYTHGLVNVL